MSNSFDKCVYCSTRECPDGRAIIASDYISSSDSKNIVEQYGGNDGDAYS